MTIPSLVVGLRAAAVAVVLAAVLCVGGTAAAQDAPAPDDAAAVAARTKEYERRLGKPLRVAERGSFVVRGDHEPVDLENLAALCEKTLEHYAGAMGVRPSDVLRAPAKGERPCVEVFQFVQERAYLEFLDRVFARIRDDTVDDKRLALMRRQRGFFVLTPRPMVVQYQGPSDFATVRSQAVHKTSHVLVLAHRRAGAWMPWWFLEGLAAWQEHGVLGESRTYCLEVERPGDYARPGTPEADEAQKARLEAAWRRRARQLVAERAARDLTVLAKLSLNELVFDDVVQSWSVVDFLHRERKLPAFTYAYKDHRDFAKTCAAALEATPAELEKRWRDRVLGE